MKTIKGHRHPLIGDDIPYSEPAPEELQALDRRAKDIAFNVQHNPLDREIHDKYLEKLRLERGLTPAQALAKTNKRRMAIMRSWRTWMAFNESVLRPDPGYEEFLWKTGRMIAQELFLHNKSRHSRIGWDEARNIVCTIDFLNGAGATFGKTHREIQSNLGTLASHNSWISRLSGSGEAWLLSEAQQDYAKASAQKQGPQIDQAQEPGRPLVLTVSGIFALARKEARDMQDNARSEAQLRQELVGDNVQPHRTDVMESLMSEVPIDPSKKRPRKNWRRQ